MSYPFDKPINETVKDYSPGSIEKESLKQKLFAHGVSKLIEGRIVT